MATPSPTTAPFRRAAILGLGLMGGSLGLALRAARLAQTIAGYDTDPDVAAAAPALGAVDEPCVTIPETVAAADLVVLAAPVMAIRDLLTSIASHLAPGALVTDLGSTKVEVVAWAEAILPDHVHFVGGHPMAGRERSGIEAADPDLYRECVWCLTPTTRTDPTALARLGALVARLGARPVPLAPDRHDADVASISHLPSLAATSLVLTAAHLPNWLEARSLAAGGFRDTTRVASGDPRMARDICLTNTEPILAALDAYLATLHDLRELLAARDPAIEEVFARARALRDAWIAGV